MFGESTPEALEIFVSRWWTNRFFRGCYSNWPIDFTEKVYRRLQPPLGRLHFGGDHELLDESYNGYVDGGYLSGIDVDKVVAKCVTNGPCAVEGRYGAIANP